MAQASDRMLEMLLDREGDWLSGEAASQALGLTRAAVWKHVRRLEQLGWRIESVTGKGYRLLDSDGPYGAAAIGRMLGTRWMGRSLEVLDTVDSTNTRLKSMAWEGAPAGMVVIADRQTGGRGRIGRTWASEPGLGVWMSVLLRPGLAPAEVQALTLAASVAVAETLDALLPPDAPRPGIKWPNDIHLDGRKVCGILTEMGAEAETVSWVVLGIGINVLHAASDFPEELADAATSLRMAAPDADWSRNRVAAELLNRLEAIADAFEAGALPDVLARWKRYSVTLGRRVGLSGPAGSQEALAVDVLPDGRLLVQTDDGGRHAVLSGEITLRPR